MMSQNYTLKTIFIFKTQIKHSVFSIKHLLISPTINFPINHAQKQTYTEISTLFFYFHWSELLRVSKKWKGKRPDVSCGIFPNDHCFITITLRNKAKKEPTRFFAIFRLNKCPIVFWFELGRKGLKERFVAGKNLATRYKQINEKRCKNKSKICLWPCLFFLKHKNNKKRLCMRSFLSTNQYTKKCADDNVTCIQTNKSYKYRVTLAKK